jgi:hypothetical protein
MPNISLRSLFFLVCRSWLCWTIIKWKRLYFYGLIKVFSVLEIEVKMLMNSFKIGYFVWNFGGKCAINNTSSSSRTFCCSFLRELVLPLDHLLNSFRKVKISISINDFLEDLLSPLHLLLVYSIQQVDFTIPRHRPGNKLIFFRRKVTMDFSWLWHH